MDDAVADICPVGRPGGPPEIFGLTLGFARRLLGDVADSGHSRAGHETPAVIAVIVQPPSRQVFGRAAVDRPLWPQALCQAVGVQQHHCVVRPVLPDRLAHAGLSLQT